MFVAFLLLFPVGVAAIFALAMFADKVLHDTRMPKSAADAAPEAERRVKLRRR
ncbi:hypothetical protein [Caballeronia sp. ATUFL_M2_KS44]|uniref:hypothetical protein n=1 Tax=Caballeronia sp. ATUFL_M2_KS44 TaxID=2921767 RepID=UPI0020281E66|nr:hypothetical protein [Caballeronia sp. ATUFL_M2_KS44]